MIPVLLSVLLPAALAADPPARPTGAGERATGTRKRPTAERCEAWSNPRLTARLDQRTDSVETTGNRVELLVDGVNSYARRRESLADADLVLVKTFLWNNDATGREIAALLADRARAGAVVVVQYDFKANAPSAQVVRELASNRDAPPPPPAVLQPVVDAGGVVVATNVPDRRRELRRTLARADGASGNGSAAKEARHRSQGGVGAFDHEKYWITGHVGEQGVELRAILGGLNVGNEYAYGGTALGNQGERGGWRDTDVEVRGPVATELAARFFDVLALNAGSLPATVDRARWVVPQPEVGEARVRFVWAQPQIGRRHTIDKLYQGLIRATPVDAPLTIETAYFAPSPATFRDLREAVKEGADLTVLTNSKASIDVPFVAGASTAAFDALLQVDPGVTLRQWRVQDGAETLHSKVASFGACGPVIVGSANLDGLSTEHNSESVVMVHDPATRAAFDAMIAADLPRADPFTVEDAQAIWWLERVWRSMVYSVGWYWL